MTNVITKAIPFEVINGRQCLSAVQIVEDPSLMDFINRFPNCFYQDYQTCFYWFYPEGVPEHLTTRVRPISDFTKEIDLDSNKITKI